MHFSHFPIALCLAAALSVSSPGLMGADKKHSKDKKDSSRVVRHTSSSSSRGSSSQHHTPVAHHSSSNNSKQHVASAHRGGSSSFSQKHHIASTNHSRTPQHRVAPSLASHRTPERHASKPVAHHTQLASHSTNHMASSRDRVVHHNTDRNDVRRAVASHSSSHSKPAVHHSSSDRHRDRSHYVQRHEHHSSDWYRTRGWSYDRDYWASNHRHRYCNDSLGIYIVDTSGPAYYDSGYGYGYSQPAPVYREYYSGVDYQTRMAVQEALAQAGYYNGAIDGIIGSGTRAAISSYQYDASLPVTGRIDDSLIQSLGIQ